MKNKKLSRVQDHLREKLRDPHVRESYAVELFKAQVAKEIITVRVKDGLTQEELAKKLGVSQQQISKIENGEFDSIETVIKVLVALDHRMVVVLPAEEISLESQHA
jgi:DNA-binding XRE family transcriptional regulator